MPRKLFMKIDPKKEEVVDLLATEAVDNSLLPVDVTEDIDGMLKFGLNQIYNLLRRTNQEIVRGTCTRETVQNLKDCMLMLHDLKEKEKDLLATLTSEDLEKL